MTDRGSSPSGQPGVPAPRGSLGSHIGAIGLPADHDFVDAMYTMLSSAVHLGSTADGSLDVYAYQDASGSRSTITLEERRVTCFTPTFRQGTQLTVNVGQLTADPCPYERPLLGLPRRPASRRPLRSAAPRGGQHHQRPVLRLGTDPGRCDTDQLGDNHALEPLCPRGTRACGIGIPVGGHRRHHPHPLGPDGGVQLGDRVHPAADTRQHRRHLAESGDHEHDPGTGREHRGRPVGRPAERRSAEHRRARRVHARCRRSRRVRGGVSICLRRSRARRRNGRNCGGHACAPTSCATPTAVAPWRSMTR